MIATASDMSLYSRDKEDGSGSNSHFLCVCVIRKAKSSLGTLFLGDLIKSVPPLPKEFGKTNF